MLQITEDTPPDMLAGAMDLTVHLPTGRAVKMSVERSTPMMDLLVQITTNYQLQLSGYTLQALGMAPSKEHSDHILPYKPNTPIGALDTQHIKVVPKTRQAPLPKNVPVGRQPFESTFRLKVHLPRNQLYVTRVSQSVFLEDIMKKVCEEKNLDPVKYEFRHPGNLDQILDPKLTLSDYAITEIYLVQKGTGNLNQFSSNDIMALRKEEERKQMHNKTGGGVFNLIFRRGKSSTTGSLSSDNRSISPTQSDDSRSVTPPAVPPVILEPAGGERPKPPQRKRRPAPKPPQDPSNSSKPEASLTICHSRNSSDSSGYHEASLLSENCNASLPRRPKSSVISEETQQNLSKMAAHSKSTSSLAFTSRKKKTAPPPPPVLKPEKSNLEEPSPVVASQPCTVVEASTEAPGCGQDFVGSTNPKPAPRSRTKIAKPAPNPNPRTRYSIESSPKNEELQTIQETQFTVPNTESVSNDNETTETTEDTSPPQNEPQNQELIKDEEIEQIKPVIAITKPKDSDQTANLSNDPGFVKAPLDQKQLDNSTKESIVPKHPNPPAEDLTDIIKQKASQLAELQKENVNEMTKVLSPETTKPEVVAFHPKSVFENKNGFQIGSSLLESSNNSGLSTPTSVASALNSFEFVDEIADVDMEIFMGSLSKNSKKKNLILHQLHGMHECENHNLKFDGSGGSLRSVSSLPGFVGGNMKKWNNFEDLDDISLHSNGGRANWVIGDTSDSESILSAQQTPADSLPPEEPEKSKVPEPEPVLEPEAKPVPEPEPEPKEDTSVRELDWQYQLPSPPKDFRDFSPVNFPEEKQESVVDSVVTSPELFEKLKTVKDQSEKETVSDITSVVSEEERPLLNKLSLENLEKRKSLVYNRELATSLKMSDEEKKPDSFTNSVSSNFQKVKVEEERKPDIFTSSLANFQKTYNEVKKSNSSPKQTSTLPNFKITTYDPKKKIDIFEDDTVRSNEKTNRSSLTKNNFGRSMENISFRKNSLEKKDEFNQEYTFFRPPSSRPNSVFRSESFTKEQWVPSRPVMRSKSQVALNRYNADAKKAVPDEDNLTKSNSLFDVSGLQSLGVMKQIQTTLNSPNTSSEQISKEPKKEPPPPKVERYRPPSINMSTWSERPKIPVNVKEDPDYKFSNKSVSTSKLIVTTTNNDVKSHNSIEVRNKTPPTNFTNTVSVRVNHDVSDRNLNIKFNNAANQSAGNVVIKIGANGATNRLRRPLANVNGEGQRPHSIAFGGDFDISRVPIVRSVELKKPYKETQGNNNNTSVTQIFHEEKRPNEVIQEQKPVFRVNTLSNTQKPAPVVRGFSAVSKQWGQPRSFSTLPTKPKNYSLNAPIPFSQSNLRRTESTHVETRSVPPPAPIMPKTLKNGSRENSGADPKEQLLQAIRDFGGKKGLRAVKA